MAVNANEDFQKLNLSLRILEDIGQEVKNAANIMPEMNFFGFSLYTLLLAELCKEFAIMLPQNPESEIILGHIDAGCAVLVGVSQIMHAKSEPIANRAKGITNIFAGGQLLWLSLIGLGPIGFMADVGLAFTHSLYDMTKTLRKINDIQFWYTDTLNKLNYLESEKSKLIFNITELQQQKTIEQGGKKRKILNWLINSRINHLQEIENMINNLQGIFNSENLDDERISTLKKELLNNSYDTLMLGTAFIGTLLLTVFGGGLPAVILITVAIVLYAYKYAPKLANIFTEIPKIFTEKLNEAELDKQFSELSKEINCAPGT